MNFFRNLSLKHKINGLVFLCNIVLISGSLLSIQKLGLAESALSECYWTLFGTSALTFLFSIWVGLKISKSVGTITQELARNTRFLDEVAAKIASGATELSSAATQQSSALQETVATMDQIGAMIHKNSDAAEKSKELSIGSKNSAEQGRQIVDSMMLAINDIETNNTELSQQMHDSNKQLAEITKLIHEISNKTQIINDIVFQTKLLSFNAAVEAARAGEYGYGFSVVAEEIGKLAQRSGGAAKDISNMLQDSVGRVEFIIEDTKNKVDKIMIVSKEKINFGSEKAKRCKDSLTEILTSIKSVDTLVLEITSASKEQSTGVGQISRAMNQLESVTNQNSAVALASSTAGEQLQSQSNTINSIVKNLNMYINGTSELVPAKPKPEARAEAKQKAKPKAKKAFVLDRKAPETSDRKVLAFEKKKPAAPLKAEPFVYKKTAGFSGKVPSGDDPGFSE